MKFSNGSGVLAINLPMSKVWIGDLIFGLVKMMIEIMLLIIPNNDKIVRITPPIAKLTGSNSTVNIK